MVDIPIGVMGPIGAECDLVPDIVDAPIRRGTDDDGRDVIPDMDVNRGGPLGPRIVFSLQFDSVSPDFIVSVRRESLFGGRVVPEIPMIGKVPSGRVDGPVRTELDTLIDGNYLPALRHGYVRLWAGGIGDYNGDIGDCGLTGVVGHLQLALEPQRIHVCVERRRTPVPYRGAVPEKPGPVDDLPIRVV